MLVQVTEGDGVDAAIADIVANVTDTDARYSVLTIAMAPCLVDGEPDEGEKQFIQKLATSFGFSKEALAEYYEEVLEQAN